MNVWMHMDAKEVSNGATPYHGRFRMEHAIEMDDFKVPLQETAMLMSRKTKTQIRSFCFRMEMQNDSSTPRGIPWGG